MNFQFLGQNTNTIVFDTSYTYRGIQVSSLNDFSSTLLPSDIFDSLSLQNTSSSITSVLPFELYIHKVGGKLNSKIHSTFGLRYRSASNYATLFYFGGEYLFNSNIVVGSIATYGGYSKFQDLEGFPFMNQEGNVHNSKILRDFPLWIRKENVGKSKISNDSPL